MTTQTIRGLLLSIIISALMVAGVLAASNAKADPQQDYVYFSLLEGEGLEITDPYKAKSTAYTVCNELADGMGWRLILAALMTAGDWDVDTAAKVFAAAVTVYCPSLKPDFGESNIA